MGLDKILHRKLVLTALALLLLCTACGKKEPEPTPDPYAGMVQVSDGIGGLMWAPLYEDVPAADFESADFYWDGAHIEYGGDAYTVMRGIDVSEHQKEIDWAAVRDSGVEFAMIRCGYRGYSEGNIYEDKNFRENAAGALEAGLQVGIYFFSQALNAAEAEAEAGFVLSLIEGLDITFPVAFDWEHIGMGAQARTDDVGGTELTGAALAFCAAIRDAGYEPAVYFYRKLGYYKYELDRLADIKFWVGAAGNYPDFYYSHDIWQYSFTGAVDGIEGDVDLNLYFVPIES